MNTCPTCKGKGKVTLTVSTFGSNKPDEKMEIDCVVCNGVGEVSDVVLEQILFEKNMWCECGSNDPSDVKYYDDGEHHEISKHHWRCNKCGKVVQIG